MVDIDERVVQMKFDSSDFEEKTKSTFKILDTLKEKLSFKNAADDSVTAFEKINENVQKMADKSYTIIDRMVDKIRDDIANKLLGFLRENTIGQIMSGWNKYADMTTSVATLKAQGFALEEINEQLNRLNFFTDETSYKFTDMVTEIGKFTAAGKSLEDSTLAMMGIANWAALSGKNANEASRAMYQLSQALGAGTMRMQDWKSIQNLNMDTQEFRKNAIAAAIEVGTLKDNLNGTYTTLVGEKAGSLTFSLNEFADKLTKGAWFTSDVMMKVFGQYANAVDEIREIVDEGGTRIANGVEYSINTAADAIAYAKEKNNEIITLFDKSEKKLSRTEITKLLEKWKKVEKVTDETVANYADVNKLTKEQARINMNQQWKEYLDEYNQYFKDSELNAEEALDNWREYVSEFGIKAFSSAQEAKTFVEAIESAKDAASTVWTQMFQLIFGNYDEAKSLWTDLANALYRIFVNRLWDIHDIIEGWYNENGRTTLFQGIYALCKGIETFITNIRQAWNNLFGGHDAAIERATNNLLSFSERFRISMFRFYRFMTELGKSEFYSNLATALHNVVEVLKTIKNIIGSVIKSFLPSGTSLVTVLENITAKIRDVTAMLIPSHRTAQNIARILRGIVSIWRILAKLVLGFIKLISPVVKAIAEILHNVINVLLEVAAAIGDIIYETDSAIDSTTSLAGLMQALAEIVRYVGNAIVNVLAKALSFLKPVIQKVTGWAIKLRDALRDLFSGNSSGKGIKTLLDNFNNFTKRIKDAWNSVDSMSETFDKFRKGTGLGNFLEMIGEMCMNVVRKIGRVITAIFGLEDVVNNNRITAKMKDFKDFISNIFVGIKWLFTNVVLPLFKNVIHGLATVFDDLGQAIANGDIIGILTNLKKIIQTLNAMAIYKILVAIYRLLGSGGILRIIRNISTTIKALGRKWNAEAANERASALLKLVAALGMVLAIMFVMAQLDDNTLERMSDNLLLIAKTFGIIMAALVIMSIVVQFTRGGLIAFALACIGLTAVLVAMLDVLNKVGEVITSMSQAEIWQTQAGGGMLVSLMAVLAGIFAVFTFIASRAGQITSAGVMMLGIGAALFGFTYALSKTSELMEKYDFTQIAQAFLIVAGGLVTLSIAIGLLNTTMASGKIKSAARAGLMTAVTTIVMVISFAFILLPALDTLAAKMDKFEEYAQGMVLFAGMILSIAGSIALINMSAGKWGLFGTLGSGAVFIVITSWLRYQFIPFIEEVSAIKFDEAIGGVAIFAIAINAIGVAMILVGTAIKKILDGLANLKVKALFGLIFGIAAVVAAISYMSTLFDKGTINWVSIGITLGTIIIVLFAMSAFVASISDSLIGPNRAEHIEKTIGKLIGLVIAIGVLVIGGALVAGHIFGDDAVNMLASFAIVVVSMTASVALIMLIMAKFIKSLSRSISINNTSGIIKTLNGIFKLLIVIFGSIVVIMGELMGWVAMGEKPESFMIILWGTLAFLSLLMFTIGQSMSSLMKSIQNLSVAISAYNLDRVNQLMTRISLIIGVIFLGMSLVLTAVGSNFGDSWIGVAAIGATMLSVITIIAVLTFAFKRIFKLLTPKVIANFSKYETIIVTFGAIASAIILSIGAAFLMLMKYQTNMNGGRLLGNTIILIGTFALIMLVMTKAFKSIVNTLKGITIDPLKFAIIETVLGVMLVAMLEICALLESLKSSELADVTGAINIVIAMIAIVGSITAAVVVLIRTMKGLTLNDKKVAIIFGALGAIVLSLVLVGESIIPALAALKDINPGSILSAFFGITVFIMALTAITIAINKLVTKNINNTLIGLAAVIVSFIAIMATISAFGDSLTDFMRSFAFIDFGDIIKALIALGGIMVEISLIGALTGVLETATGHLNLVGIVAMIITLTALGGILQEFGDGIANFFYRFREIEGDDVLRALAAISGLLLIVDLVGTITGILTGELFGLNLVGIIVTALTILGMAKILELSAPMFETFFDVFAKYENWDAIWKGLLVIGAIGAGAALIGTAMTAAIPGIITFAVVILALAGALYILAAAYEKFQGVNRNNNQNGIELSDNSKAYAKTGKKDGTAYATGFNNGYATKEQIKSPSRVFARYGKYIDAGLIKGLRSNISGIKSASSTLAIATNETFCDELGIASPSKVFYENGRFVIRGFINGMNSEQSALNNQGYDIGTNVADGIKDGMESTDWEGLFGEGGFDKILEDALGEGGKGIVDYLSDQVGVEGFSEENLSEDEKILYNYYKKLEEANEKAHAELGKTTYVYNPVDKIGVTYKYDSSRQSEENYSKTKTAIQNKIKELEKKGTITTGWAGLFQGGIKNGILDGVTSIFGDTEVVNKFGELGENIVGFFNKWNSGKGKDEITETAKGVGNSFVDGITSAINSSSVMTTIGGFISNITDKIKEAFGSSGLVKGIMKAGYKFNLISAEDYADFLYEIGEITKSERDIKAVGDHWWGHSEEQEQEIENIKEIQKQSSELLNNNQWTKDQFYSSSGKDVLDSMNELVKKANSKGVEYTEIGSMMATGIRNGWWRTWDSEKGQYVYDIDAMIKQIEKALGIASPSKLFIWIGEMINAGFAKGIDLSSDQTLKAMAGITDGILDEVDTINQTSITLPNLLDENVTPTLTPILDDSNIQNGINLTNRSFNAMNPQVDAAISAFVKDVPDYSTDFDILQSAIINTNTLINNLMDMLETGDITTVNVEVAPVPDNIYESVINTNHQRFKRTGRNGFLS